MQRFEMVEGLKRAKVLNGRSFILVFMWRLCTAVTALLCVEPGAY